MMLFESNKPTVTDMEVSRTLKEIAKQMMISNVVQILDRLYARDSISKEEYIKEMQDIYKIL